MAIQIDQLVVRWALAAWFGNNLPETLKARVLGVQASVGVAFLAHPCPGESADI